MNKYFEKKIVKKSRLEPGKMLLVDTKKKKLIEDYDLKNEYASSNPYGEWLDNHLLYLKDLPAPDKKTHIHSQHERDILYKEKLVFPAETVCMKFFCICSKAACTIS